MRNLFVLKFAMLAACLIDVSFAAGSSFQIAADPRLLPASVELPGWAAAGPSEHYEREGLYGYINGGSEIFLQYDFRRVEAGRYKKTNGETGPEVTVDLYQMGSVLDAYGIFSIRREGGEKTLDLGGIPNWLSESQASLASGVHYVNIIGFETKAEDLAAFARLIAKKLQAAGNKPIALAGTAGPWTALPRYGLLPDTIRFIKGKLAAQEESEILAPDFWKFAEGTIAASAKYGPDARKLIVVDYAAEPAGLADGVKNVFREYLANLREECGILSAKNSAGHIFLFGAHGRRAALVFGKRDESAARVLLAAALR